MIRLGNVLKISLQDILKTSTKCLKGVLKMSWSRFCMTSWKRLETSWRRTSKMNILILTKTFWRHLVDVFWTRKAKVNIFVLIKTSCLQDVFWRRGRKMSSRGLQDVFIKTNVCCDFYNKKMLQIYVCSVTLIEMNIQTLVVLCTA